MTNIRKFKRQFIEIDGRAQHFRYGGEGPVIVLLHQSPQSSAAVASLAQRLMENFTVVAPDTPGYGQSAPLPLTRPEMADYAAALRAFFQAIGLKSATIVGTHTGAAIAAEFAWRYPQHAHLLILDGMPLFNAEENHDILCHYFPPFVPTWDGSHLTWLWARVREQLIFFPWHRAEAACRMHYDMPAAEYLHSAAMDFLISGDHYRVGYAAVFRQPSHEVVGNITVPAAYLYRENDPLSAHQPRLPAINPQSWKESIPPDRALMDQRIVEIAREHPPNTSDAWRLDARLPQGAGEIFIDLPDGQMALSTLGDADKPALMLVHDYARGRTQLMPLAKQLASDFFIVLPDLPGHGDSDVPPEAAFDPRTLAAMLLQVLEKLGIKSTALYATYGSSAIGLELASLAPERCHALALDGVFVLTENQREEYLQAYPMYREPHWAGHHMHELWLAIRDSRLFFPWFKPGKDSMFCGEPNLDPEDLQREFVDALRCGCHLAEIQRQMISGLKLERLKQASQACLIIVDRNNPRHPMMESLREQLGPSEQRQYHTISENEKSPLAEVLKGFLMP